MEKTKGTILLIGNHFRSGKTNRNVWHELPSHLIDTGWTVICTSKHTSRLLRLFDMLLTILIKRKNYQIAEVDVFSGPSFLWAELSALLIRVLNKPLILTLHGGNLPELAKRNPNRVKRVLASANTVVAPSAYLQKQLCQYREDIHVLPNPVNISDYTFRLRTSPAPNLVWVRAFHEIYNPSLAPKMLHELLKNWPKAHLTMVGPDKGDGSLKRMLELAVSLGVRDHITITGGVPSDEIPKFLQEGDIFINTTHIDNTPVSMIEAMACGLCIISTNVGGISYLVEDEKEALLVPPDNPSAMAKTIERLLSNNRISESISLNARLKAENFNWPKIANQWNTLLIELIEHE
jgi:glycosyltransferase involved in cell wall biosynthesis